MNASAWAEGLPTAPHAKVVLVVIDAFGPEYMDGEQTPAMAALAAAGGHAPAGGLSDLISSTGPGHATLLTGTRPVVHGLLANRLFGPDGEIRRGVRAQVPSIFQTLQAEGYGVRAVVGDPNILITVNIDGADWTWPDAETRASKANPATTYMPDPVTTDAAVEAIGEGSDFLFVHLQDVDSIAHRTGVDSEASRVARQVADASIARIAEALRPDWDRTMLIVLSDHRTENVTSSEPVRLAAALAGYARVVDDGSGALVEPLPGIDPGHVLIRALAVPGVAGIGQLASNHFAVSAEPGRAFGREDPITTLAQHGSWTARPCLSVVGGGHPAVSILAERLLKTAPPLHIWAGVIRAVLSPQAQ